MKAYRKNSFIAPHAIRLDRGEKILDALQEYLAQEEIQAGYLTGIGALRDVTLGYYDLEGREYHRHEYDGEYELLQLTGNVSQGDGEIIIHAHVTLAGPDLKAFGGHLFGATVAVTAEIWLFPFPVALTRAFQEEIGLKLLS